VEPQPGEKDGWGKYLIIYALSYNSPSNPRMNKRIVDMKKRKVTLNQARKTPRCL
jgi:hypothetical protein